MKHRSAARIALLSLLSSSLLGAQRAAADEGFSISCEETKVTIEYDGKLVTRYLYRDDATNKPYFWPVMGPTGKRMTRAFPMEKVEGEKYDHPHHRSIWFGHQGVGGTDTWLEAASKKHKNEEDEKAFLKGLGSTQHLAFSEISANRQQAVIRSRNDYLDSDGKQLMADERAMIFRMAEGKLILDFDVTLIGKYGDIELQDKKDAGLNVRIPTTMTLKNGEGHIVNSNGTRDGDCWSKKAAWVDYFGPVEGEQLGVAFFNHPSSFRHPTRWHVRDYGLFTANAFGLKSLDGSSESGTFTLKKDERVLLKHRIILHEGDEKAAGIADEYQDYASTKVLCYGDSITAAQPGWVAILDKADLIDTHNAGRGGRRAANAKEELKPYLAKNQGEPIDRVLIFLGVNDLPARDVRPGDEKIASCVKGMSEAIDLALKRFSPDQVVLVAPCGVNEKAMSSRNVTKGYEITQPLLEQLKPAYQKLAEEKGVKFLSLLNVVSKPNYEDGLHPSEAGHKEIAEAVEAFLKK